MNKKIFLNLLIFFFFIILLFKTNFIKNIISVYNLDENDRITKTYGYCGGESIGYLKYLKKEFNFKSNPKIINFIHTPPINWSIYNPKKYKKSDYLIVLNYPGKIFEKELVYLKENFYEIKDPYYLSTISKSLSKISLKNYKSRIKEINFYKNSDTGKLTLLKKIDYRAKNYFEHYPIKLDFKEFNIDENRLFVEIIANTKIPKTNKVKVSFQSIIDIEVSKIINSTKNCYLVK